MERYLVDDVDMAAEALDNAGIGYDFDSGDRLMLDEDSAAEAEELFDSLGIGYDVI